MSSQQSGDSDANKQAQLLQKIDQICDRFEAAWCAGLNPLIEDHIRDVTGPLRSRLLRELVALEVAYRRQSGETPVCAEYETRFTSDTAMVREGFDGCLPIGSASGQDKTETFGSSDTPPGHLEVRCPSCHTPMRVAVDTSLTELTCESCGSHFSLVDQGQATQMAPPLSQLGRFELVERLGVGGFGSVWKARDKELDRTVAIKIPRQGTIRAEEQERFFHEARAGAQLHHPNIVSVHEVGRDGDSVYIVSDFIRGVTLDDWLTGQKLTGREVAELCVKIADALHHAHEEGVIHRDLKPSNIMIDGDGEPHLMDFGLARREVGEVTVTVDGQILGTPAYMSPEQAQGEAHQADRRSDVYSLGVILFQLLTGELPFRGNPRMLIHQVINDEPPSPRKLSANVPMDLETITLKCMEKEPGKRYQSAGAASEELNRWLKKEPIQARPIGVGAKAWRWARRKPMVASLSAAIVCLLVAATLIAMTAAARFMVLAQERETALQDAVTERLKAEALAERNRQSLYASRINLVQLAYSVWQERDVARARELLKLCIAAPGEDDQRDFAWHYLWGKCQEAEQYRLHVDQTFLHKGRVTALAISSDGTKLASGGSDVLRMWNTKTGNLEWEMTDLGERIRAIALSKDGSFLVSGGSSLRIWNLADGSHVKFPDAGLSIDCVAISNDETRLASGHQARVVKLWDLHSQELLRTFRRHAKAVRSVVFSPDGQTLVSGDAADSMRVWDVSSGEQVGAALVGRDAAFTPDGHTLAAVGRTHLVQLWDVSVDTDIKPLPGIEIRGLVKDLAFADDRLLTLAYNTGQWETCDVSRGQVVGSLHGKQSTVNPVAISPRATCIASATFDGSETNLQGQEENNPAGMSTVQLWQVKMDETHKSPASTTDWLMSVALGRDGKSLAMATGRISSPYAAEGGTVSRVMVETGERLPLPDPKVDKVKVFHWLCLTLSPDNAWLACGGYSSDIRGGTEGIVVLQPMQSDSSDPIVLRHEDWVRSIAFSRDGNLMAVGGRLGPTVLWDMKDWKNPKKLAEFEIPSWALMFSPDDQILAAGGGHWSHGMIALVDVKSHKVLESSDDLAGLVTSVVFLPDKRTLAVADYKGNITLYDQQLQELDTIGAQNMPAHNVAIRSLAVSAPTESRAVLASAGEDGLVKLWYIPTRTQLGRLPNNVAIYSLSFADDGSSLAAGMANGTVKLWRTQGEDRVFRVE